MHYDIIGDIHGHADKLERLLLKLGYRMRDGIYRQAGHQPVFVGDFIDRGQQNRRTIEVVRNMVMYGDGHAVMGNHEYNAVCYHTRKNGSPTDYLRPHSFSKFRQHEHFLREYPLGREDTNEVIDWFKQLPLFLEFDHFRVVHACWDDKTFIRLKKGNYLEDDTRLKKEHWAKSADEGTPLFALIELVLKGEEAQLPGDEFFLDKDGNRRTSIRLKWWGDKSGNCKDVAFGYDPQTMLSFPCVKPEIPADSQTYPKDKKPVFFGHYWQVGTPVLQQQNLCCLDYSAGKGGDLVCYRFRDSDPHSTILKVDNLIC